MDVHQEEADSLLVPRVSSRSRRYDALIGRRRVRDPSRRSGSVSVLLRLRLNVKEVTARRRLGIS